MSSDEWINLSVCGSEECVTEQLLTFQTNIFNNKEIISFNVWELDR